MTNQELFEKAVAGNWIAETFERPTVGGGIGKFYLKGTSKGYATFGDTVNDGDVVFYAAFDDDCNRESGFGVFNADDQSITPVESNATLANGKYIDGDVQPIPFPKGGTITGTFNAVAFNAIWNHVWDRNNPHEVVADQVEQDNGNELGDNVQDALDNLSGIIAEWDAAIKATCQNYVSELPPPNPDKGDMWTDVGVSGEQYVWEGDYWVSVTGGGLGIDLDDPEALPGNIVRDEVGDEIELLDKPLNRVISSYDGAGKWVEATGGGGGGDPEWADVGKAEAEGGNQSVYLGHTDKSNPWYVEEAVAVGFNADAGYSGVGIGHASYGGMFGVAVGANSRSSNNATAIGNESKALKTLSIALGHGAETTRDYEFAIAPSIKHVNFSKATVQAADYLDADGNSIIGAGGGGDGGGDPEWAKVDKAEPSTALGWNCRAISGGTAVGFRAHAGGENCTAVGYFIEADGSGSVALGTDITSLEEGSIAIGNHVYVDYECTAAICIGQNASVEGGSEYAIALGSGAGSSDEAPYAIALGYQADAVANELAISRYTTKVNFSKATVRAKEYLDADGNPATVSPSSIVEAFTTLQTAVADENTVEGIKTALTNALGGLIEKFEGINNA